MTVDVMWMRCLDKRNHVILDEAVILRAGLLKAACKRRVYLLSVSACPRRCCRACLKVVHAVSDSLSQRIPEQRTRLRVVSEVPESLTVTSPAFPSSTRGARLRVGFRSNQYPSGPAGVPLSPPPLKTTVVDRLLVAVVHPAMYWTRQGE
jgi:hypothetical protein